MSEIYRDSTGKGITLDIPGAVVTAAKFIKAGVETVGSPSADSVQIPYSVTYTNGDFSLVWTYVIEGNTYNRTDTFTVVTPYVSIAGIKEALGASAVLYSDAELMQAERRARGIIDAHTGQSFGKFEGTRTVVGAGDGQLKLTDRLVSITTLSGPNVIPDSRYYTVRGGGYYIGITNPLPDTGDLVFTSVIRDPDSMYHSATFNDNTIYSITGVWGWESVPTDIAEAAILLVEDSLDPDSEYRERYGAIVRAADWTFEYHNKAYEGTGNATADRLLEPYRRWSMTVI